MLHIEFLRQDILFHIKNSSIKLQNLLPAAPQGSVLKRKGRDSQFFKNDISIDLKTSCVSCSISTGTVQYQKLNQASNVNFYSRNNLL
jgi:hypothetical protein